MIGVSSIFNANYYLARNADVAAAGVDALAHYLSFGKYEGRNPSALFDATYYIEQNTDVAAAGVNAFDHFLAHGQYEGRAPKFFFDQTYYLQNNPDVAEAGVDALEHYLTFGGHEGRDPNTNFSSSFYLQSHQDVAEAGANPLIHFLTFGILEKRANSFTDLNALEITNITFAEAIAEMDIEKAEVVLRSLTTDNNSAMFSTRSSDDSVMALPEANSMPALSGLGNPTFLENTVNASAQIIDENINLTYYKTSFSGGLISIIYSEGGGAEDSISIANVGNDVGQIGFDGTNVSYEGANIGTITGANNGAAGTDLAITFNSAATVAAVNALLNSLTYANNSNTPEATRSFYITVKDDNGAASAAQSTITVTAEAEASAILSLSGLDGTNGFRLDGAVADDWSGVSVSYAGDINNDGFADVIIGARNADPGGNGTAGSTYIIFGKAGASAANTNLSTLDGSTGFGWDGTAASDMSGRSVSSAGDVNGDGYDDFIIGAEGADPGGNSASGSSYIIFGKAGAWAAGTNLSTLDGTNGFRLDGVAANDSSGRSVSSAGDINGDGFADIIIGARYADPGANGNSGSTYVIFGKAGVWAPASDLSTLDGTTGFRWDGVAMGDQSGYSVSSASDVNGDGYDDIAIGANGADPDGNNGSGSTYIIFGKAGAWAASNDFSSLDGTNGFRLDGVSAGDQSGVSVSSAGDVNGDGYADVIIGAPIADPDFHSSAGSTYVVFGKAGGFAANTNLSVLDGTNGFRLDGTSANDWSGYSVSSAGDFNGDGYDDIIIGAKRANPVGNDSGSTYIIFGKSDGFSPTISLSTLSGSDGFRLEGVVTGDKSGGSVSSAGDINGDGFADVIIGAYDADPGGNNAAGSTYIVFGNNDTGAITHLGTSGNDTLTGDVLGNKMIGGLGDDVMNGAAGADIIKGANGADRITGGAGADRMWGGSGADNFVFTADADSGIGAGNRDIIYDFETTVDDIDLSAFAGTFTFRDTNAFTGGANEVRLEITGNNTVIEVDSNGDGAADFEISILGANDLVAGDFIL